MVMENLEQLKRRLERDVEDACKEFVSRLKTDILDAKPLAAQELQQEGNLHEAQHNAETAVGNYTHEAERRLRDEGVRLHRPVSGGTPLQRTEIDSQGAPSNVHSSTCDSQAAQQNAMDQVKDLRQQLGDLRQKLDSVSHELAVYKKAQGILSRGYEREKRMKTELEAEVKRLREKHNSDKDLIKAYRAASERWRGRLHTELNISCGGSTSSVSPSGKSFRQPTRNRPLPDHGNGGEIVPQTATKHQHYTPTNDPVMCSSSGHCALEYHSPRSSQTTQEDEAGQTAHVNVLPNQKAGDGDVEPIVVSSRRLKRKREQGTSRENTTNVSKSIRAVGSSEEPFMIKQEDCSPPNIVVDATVEVHDSNQDLDVDIDPLRTPQKNRMQKMDRMRRRLDVPLSTERYARAVSDPLDLVLDAKSHSMEKDEYTRSNRRSLNLTERNPPSTSKPDVANVLQPLPLNRIINEPDARAILFPAAKRYRKTIHGAEQTEAIIEPFDTPDGASAAPYPYNAPSRLDPVQKKYKSSSHEQAILEHHPHDKSSLATKNISTNYQESKHGLDPGETLPNNIVIKQEQGDSHQVSATLRKPAKTRRRVRKSEPIPRVFHDQPHDPAPEDEPLRARPLSRLTLEDFKINPRANQGISYAFAEPVRTIEAKRCLPGCTDPSCCGDAFRALAAATGGRFTHKRGLWDDSQDDADHALLEEYLGDDRARIGRLSADEREELLLQARAAQLAQKHGKHRTSHARRSTPAGYWDADWPSTQQAAENREKTVQTVRDAIAERRAEAMRNNGRWMFRDE